MEIENAVTDLIQQVVSYQFESSQIESVPEDDIAKLRDHYNHFMYQSLLFSAKNSMIALKKRIGSRKGTNILGASKPFFEVDVQLVPPNVSLSPSLDEIQQCINKSAQAILSCYKKILDWGYSSLPKEKRASHTFFNRITKDIELVKVALLLTGCIQGIRNTVAEYLDSFSQVHLLACCCCCCCCCLNVLIRIVFCVSHNVCYSPISPFHSTIGFGKWTRIRPIRSLPRRIPHWNLMKQNSHTFKTLRRKSKRLDLFMLLVPSHSTQST